MNMQFSVIIHKIRDRWHVVLIMSLMLGVFMISSVSCMKPIVRPHPTPGIITVIGPSSVINETTIKGKCMRAQIYEGIEWDDDDIEDIDLNKKMGDTLRKYILETVDVEAIVCKVPDLGNLTVDFGSFGNFVKKGTDVKANIRKSTKQKRLNVIIKFSPFPFTAGLECGCTVTIENCTCCCGNDDICECRL